MTGLVHQLQYSRVHLHLLLDAGVKAPQAPVTRCVRLVQRQPITFEIEERPAARIGEGARVVDDVVAGADAEQHQVGREAPHPGVPHDQFLGSREPEHAEVEHLNGLVPELAAGLQLPLQHRPEGFLHRYLHGLGERIADDGDPKRALILLLAVLPVPHPMAVDAHESLSLHPLPPGCPRPQAPPHGLPENHEHRVAHPRHPQPHLRQQDRQQRSQGGDGDSSAPALVL